MDDAKHPVEEIAEATGGTITEAGILPDGSGFAVMSRPLPPTHWLYGDKTVEDEHGYEAPPMPLRMGLNWRLQFQVFEIIANQGDQEARITHHQTGVYTRYEMAELLRRAGRYAVRAATMKGTEEDFDPDALVQNLVTGMLGYFTDDGLSDDEWANPKAGDDGSEALDLPYASNTADTPPLDSWSAGTE